MSCFSDLNISLSDFVHIKLLYLSLPHLHINAKVPTILHRYILAYNIDKLDTANTDTETFHLLC
jgi:hypothetical protein